MLSTHCVWQQNYHCDFSWSKKRTSLLYHNIPYIYICTQIPVSGRNPLFKNTVVGPKPHILVLNKKDLTRGDIIPQVKTYIRDREQVENVIFTNCRDQKCTGLKEVGVILF